jgi:hypothetical protein
MKKILFIVVLILLFTWTIAAYKPVVSVESNWEVRIKLLEERVTTLENWAVKRGGKMR